MLDEHAVAYGQIGEGNRCRLAQIFFSGRDALDGGFCWNFDLALVAGIGLHRKRVAADRGDRSDKARGGLSLQSHRFRVIRNANTATRNSEKDFGNSGFFS